MPPSRVYVVGGVFVALVLLLLSGSFNLTPSFSAASASSARSASAAGCPRSNPPLSIEWTGRDTMTVGFNGAISVEVQKHDFPGCVHSASDGRLVAAQCGVRGKGGAPDAHLCPLLLLVLVLVPSPPPLPPRPPTCSPSFHQGMTFGRRSTSKCTSPTRSV